MQLVIFNQKEVNLVLSIPEVSCISSSASLREQHCFAAAMPWLAAAGGRQGEEFTGSELLCGRMKKGH